MNETVATGIVTTTAPAGPSPGVEPQAELCDGCRRISLEALLETDNRPHETFASNALIFAVNSPETCPLCKLVVGSHGSIEAGAVVEMAVNYAKPDPNTSEPRMIRGVTVRSIDKKSGSFRLFADEDTEAARHIVGRRAGDPGSQKTLSKIRGFVTDCDRNHCKCRLGLSRVDMQPEQQLPTRVVAVGSDNEEPKLVISNGARGRYICLSHCWGPRGTTVVVRTTRNNTEAHKREIRLGTLSKTFREAIQLTRMLEVPYIWIDSLCIVQDDPTDWSREAKVMGSLYEKAYLSIAATSARTGNDGCFLPKPHQDIVRLLYSSGSMSQEYFYATSAKCTAGMEVDDGPFNRQVTPLAEELDSLGSAQPASTVEEQQLRLKGFQEAWAEIAKVYSACDITRATDRLPALLGIARIIEGRTGFRFYEGHWKNNTHNFLRSRLWTVSRGGSSQSPDLTGRPTWAWISRNCPVEYSFAIKDPGNCEWAADGQSGIGLSLHDIQPDEQRDHLFLHKLEVSGVVKAATIDRPLGSERPFPYIPDSECHLVCDEGRQLPIGWARFDAPNAAQGRFLCCPVYHEKNTAGDIERIPFLARVQKGSSPPEDEFVRVGMGIIDMMITVDGNEVKEEGDLDYFKNCSRRKFTLV